MTRSIWGGPDGVPAGADLSLEAVLTIDGAVNPSQVTSSGTFSLSIGSSLLIDEAADAVTSSDGLVKWDITSIQSSPWVAGTHEGDIKLVDSGGAVSYWPVSLQVRKVVD